MKGKTVQLKPEQLHHDEHTLMVHTSTAKKIEKAKAHNKGLRLGFSEGELIEGGALKDTLAKIGKFLKGVVDTPFYQKTVRPVVRGAIDELISAAPVPSLFKEGAQKLVEVGSRKTGAFGYRGKGLDEVNTTVVNRVPDSSIMPAPGLYTLTCSSCGHGGSFKLN